MEQNTNKTITHIALPESERGKARRCSFYLAMEEYVAAELRQLDDCFFLWQVKPTVIFGRNQLIDTEVNVDFCRANDIDMIRRKSGGGCVYADMSNVMFSYVGSEDKVAKSQSRKVIFAHYLQRTVDMLRSLGVEAYASERNDVMIGGRKVSGYAFYHVPGRNIIHGTMLYDTDMHNMVGAITPSDQKLVSKGVESVRQHICLLKDYIGDRISVEQYNEYAISYMCNDEYVLTPGQVRQIEEIQRGYHDEAYIYGHNPRCTMERSVRVEGVGEFRVLLELRNGIIIDLNLMGDFFLTGDLNELLAKFRRAAYTRQALADIISGVEPSDYIMNLSKENLLQVLIED